jgi:hypothetical protein
MVLAYVNFVFPRDHVASYYEHHCRLKQAPAYKAPTINSQAHWSR